MNDKDLMENLLLVQKGACDLYMHGAIESSTQNVHTTFKTAFDDALKTQNDIYNKMSAKERAGRTDENYRGKKQIFTG